MLTSSLINLNTPRLQLQDTVAKARQLVNDFKLTHLPVVSESSFLGLISEEDLMDAEEEKQTMETLQEHFLKIFVPDDVHFLVALQYCNMHETNIVPVLNRQQDFVGVINSSDLMKVMGDFSGANEMGGLIILALERVHFSISEISRIVESNDCTILHLNTANDAESGLMHVTLHLNKREISSVVSTFERYEYQVAYHFGAKIVEDKTTENYLNLMNYLNL